MPKLPIEHPDIYKKFLKVKLLVKTQIGNFNRLSPDMILEQTIQSSKKYAAGIIGQIRQLSYVTEWGLIYYEVVAISNVYQNIISGGLSFRETNLHHELGGSLYKLMNESVNKTYRFISERGNPYLTSQYGKLHHLTTGQCVNETDSKKLLEYFEHGGKTLLNSVTRDFLIRQKRYLMLLKRFHCHRLNQNLKNQQNLNHLKKIQKQKFKPLPRNRLILPNLDLFQCQKSYSLILFQVLYLKGILQQNQKSTC